MSWKNEWLRLFPEADYAPAMNLRALDGRAFFEMQDDAALEEKRRILEKDPTFYRCETAEEEEWATFLGTERERLADSVEPDWVIVLGAEGKFTIAGGCVCFPTMWSLPKKIGLPLAAVHGPVPGLNAALGAKIDLFLGKLPLLVGYGRENWGLASSPALDQHPRHGLASISPEATLSEVWLRVEEQALLRLSESVIVFGIRIQNVRLDELPTGEIRRRLARALRSLPPEMAEYKRLTECRESISRKLEQ